MILIDRIVTLRSRSPCGERGLKYVMQKLTCDAAIGRSPCGERGLKYPWRSAALRADVSLPVRGAWIEIVVQGLLALPHVRRSPCGERGLK